MKQLSRRQLRDLFAMTLDKVPPTAPEDAPVWRQGERWSAERSHRLAVNDMKLADRNAENRLRDLQLTAKAQGGARCKPTV